jgi:hypothetical protein
MLVSICFSSSPYISMICMVGFYDLETNFYGPQCHRNQLYVSKKLLVAGS